MQMKSFFFFLSLSLLPLPLLSTMFTFYHLPNLCFPFTINIMAILPISFMNAFFFGHSHLHPTSKFYRFQRSISLSVSNNDIYVSVKCISCWSFFMVIILFLKRKSEVVKKNLIWFYLHAAQRGS